MIKFTLDRITGDKLIADHIAPICTCLNCHKQSLQNLHYVESCHKGTYCQDCISFCMHCKSATKMPIPGLYDLLNQVSISCIYKAQGCSLLLKPNELESHEICCSFKPKVTASEVKSRYFPLDTKLDPTHPHTDNEEMKSEIIPSNSIILLQRSIRL